MHHKYSPNLPLLFSEIHFNIIYHSLIQIFWKSYFLHILWFNFVCVFSGLWWQWHEPPILKSLLRFSKYFTSNTNYTAFYSLLPFALSLVQTFSCALCSHTAPVYELFYHSVPDTLNPCHSTNVREYRQQVKQKYFISSSLRSWTGYKNDNRLRREW